MKEENINSSVSKNYSKLEKNKNKPTENQDQLLDDLKDSLKSTVSSTANLLEDLISNIETSVKDESIKIKARKIVSDINEEFINILDNTQNNILESVNAHLGSSKEEE